MSEMETSSRLEKVESQLSGVEIEKIKVSKYCFFSQFVSRWERVWVSHDVVNFIMIIIDIWRSKLHYDHHWYFNMCSFAIIGPHRMCPLSFCWECYYIVASVRIYCHLTSRKSKYRVSKYNIAKINSRKEFVIKTFFFYRKLS